MEDMLSGTIKNAKIKDLYMGSALKTLLEATEADMYSSPLLPHEKGLIKTLKRLGIKSASTYKAGLEFGGMLQMESLDATLRGVTFDMAAISRWKADGGK